MQSLLMRSLFLCMMGMVWVTSSFTVVVSLNPSDRRVLLSGL